MSQSREDEPNPLESEFQIDFDDDAQAPAGSAPAPGAGPAPDADAPPGAGQPRLPNFKGLSAIEISSLAAAAVLLLAALLAFVFMWKGQVVARKHDVAATRFKQSVAGELMSIASLDTYWKQPGPHDRVRPDQALVPEVLVRLGTAKLSEDAYLKAVFRDAEGTIRGDVTSYRIANGTFADTGAPERRLFGTDGFTDELDFVRYSSTNSDSWTVEIFEGPSYGGSAWNRLAFVTIGATLRDSASPEN